LCTIEESRFYYYLFPSKNIKKTSLKFVPASVCSDTAQEIISKPPDVDFAGYNFSGSIIIEIGGAAFYPDTAGMVGRGERSLKVINQDTAVFHHQS